MSSGVATQIIPSIKLQLNSTFFNEKRIASKNSHILKLASTYGYDSKELAPKLVPLIKDPKIAQILREKVQLAKKLDPTYIPHNFDEWYELIFEPKIATAGKLAIQSQADQKLPLRKDVVDFAKKLQASPEFITAEALGPVVPAQYFKPSDDPHGNYVWDYKSEAPVGTGAIAGWLYPGGLGDTESITHFDFGWALGHEDLAGLTMVPGTVNNPAGVDALHGTACMGQIIMRDNTVGGLGIVPHARGKALGMLKSDGTGLSFAEAFGLAFEASQPGEVFFLPLQFIFGIPLEFSEEVYYAFRLATALGIHVVVAAGNGGWNTDNLSSDGNFIFRRNDPGFRGDSGAIWVGATNQAVPHVRSSFSNYGSRVDVYAAGENIFSASTNGAGTATNQYRSGLDGTSFSSPIIAGVVAQIQGMYKWKTGENVTPSTMRNVYLKFGGTTPANFPESRIGVMPNVYYLARAFSEMTAGAKELKL